MIILVMKYDKPTSSMTNGKMLFNNAKSKENPYTSRNVFPTSKKKLDR